MSLLCFEEPSEGLAKALVKCSGLEGAEAALQLAERELLPRLFRREPVALDFAGMTMCTQSHAHALLFEALRVAWAFKTPIYILNAQPTVRSTLALVENYALGG